MEQENEKGYKKIVSGSWYYFLKKGLKTFCYSVS